MIRHCVFLRFRSEIGDDEKHTIYRDLASLRDRIPGFGSMAAGVNSSPEGLSQGYDDGFVIEFADASARDAYLTDAGHVEVGARLVALLDGGVDGLVVFDLED